MRPYFYIYEYYYYVLADFEVTDNICTLSHTTCAMYGNISKEKKGTKECTEFVPSFSGEEYLF